MALQVSLRELFGEAVKKNASDVHISVGIPPVLRVDEKLHPLKHPPLDPADVRDIITTLLTEEQFESYLNKKELDFSLHYPISSDGMSVRLRGNCFFERGNMAMAFRVIPKTIRLIEHLILPKQLHDVARRRQGLFLVTGPTGHGKSTTLAAIIQEINISRSCHIVTIEDPIEYLFHSDRSMIHQREIGIDTTSFAEALKRVLRQDPDVIMIGEMRDLETVRAALTAAETGHLVLATLHTPDAPQSIDRILDVFSPHQQDQVKLQLANVLIGICSQQLLPLPGGGRIVATELMWAVPAVRNCIRERKIHGLKSIIQTGLDQGMHTMDQDLARLIREGKVPYELAASYAFDIKDLDRMVLGEGTSAFAGEEVMGRR